MPDINPLTRESVNGLVVAGSIGNYILYDNKYALRYVGRSDTDLQERLLDHVGEYPYRYFKFWYANSKEEAYYIECEQYHRNENSKKFRNEDHPARPDGMESLRCPICYMPLG